jgi:hypothetical protein
VTRQKELPPVLRTPNGKTSSAMREFFAVERQLFESDIPFEGPAIFMRAGALPAVFCEIV